MIFSLLLSVILFSSPTTEAATTKTAFVKITSGTLNVRSKASTTAKKVGSLKKGVRVVVYAKTKSGWSEIRYKKKKAYVSTQYLKFANSYLMDKSKIYTYKYDGQISKHTYMGVYQGYKGSSKWSWDEWRINGTDSYIVTEDIKGLYPGYINSEYYVAIQYPIEIGSSWDIGYEGDGTAKVTSVSKTVKTPAGTFTNCIEVRSDSGSKSYYAKNIGFVKFVYNGKNQTELISLKKK